MFLVAGPNRKNIFLIIELFCRLTKFLEYNERIDGTTYILMMTFRAKLLWTRSMFFFSSFPLYVYL